MAAKTAAWRKESPMKPVDVERRSYMISSKLAVAVEEHSPKKGSSADKENNSPMSHRNVRSAKKLKKPESQLLCILEEGEATSGVGERVNRFWLE